MDDNKGMSMTEKNLATASLTMAQFEVMSSEEKANFIEEMFGKFPKIVVQYVTALMIASPSNDYRAGLIRGMLFILEFTKLQEESELEEMFRK